VASLLNESGKILSKIDEKIAKFFGYKVEEFS